MMEILCSAEYGFIAAASKSFRLLIFPGFLLLINETTKVCGLKTKQVDEDSTIDLLYKHTIAHLDEPQKLSSDFLSVPFSFNSGGHTDIASTE